MHVRLAAWVTLCVEHMEQVLERLLANVRNGWKADITAPPAAWAKVEVARHVRLPSVLQLVCSPPI